MVSRASIAQGAMHIVLVCHDGLQLERQKAYEMSGVCLRMACH